MHIDKTSLGDEAFNGRKLNLIYLETIKEAVRSNVRFPDYYMTYVDKNVNLNVVQKCLCPMHEENEPSFRYFMDTDTFSCFGKCHVAGDVIRFHEVYLKFLLRSGQMTKYRNITTMLAKEINYYTAMEDLIKIYHLRTPPVFLDNIEDKVATQEQLYAYFIDKPEQIKLSKVDASYDSLNNSIIRKLIIIKPKNNDFFKEKYKEYAKIVTSGESLESLTTNLRILLDSLERR